MKKLLIVIPLVFILACVKGNNGSSPSGLTSIDDPGAGYGSCVVALPKVALAKAPGEKFIFDLSITGPGMEEMHFSWYLSGNDTQAYINKIPPGDMRIFAGMLTSSRAGVTHIGDDTVAIVAGKTAYVNLFLKRTGNAVVHVTIEGMEEPPLMKGCYTVEGVIDTMKLTNMTLRILSDSTDEYMNGVVTQYGQVIGKVSGPNPTLSTPFVSWYLGLAYGGTYMLKVSTDGAGRSFKSVVYKMPDTTRSVGTVFGHTSACEEPVVPMTGCYTFQGNLDTTTLQNMKLKIITNQTAYVAGVVLQNAKEIGKFDGPMPSPRTLVTWKLFLASSGSESFLLKVATDGSGSSYKSIAYKPSDTTRSVGNVFGFRTACEDSSVSMTGCYTFEGELDTAPLWKMKLKILSGQEPIISGEVLQNDTMVGRFSGPVPISGAYVTWRMSFINYTSLLLKITTDAPGNDYRGIAYQASDTTRPIGKVEGYRISCDTVIPPSTCVIDTMGDPTSCKDIETWTKYAANDCANRGMKMTRLTPLAACTTDVGRAFSWICFECCK